MTTSPETPMVQCGKCGFLTLRRDQTGEFVEVDDALRKTGYSSVYMIQQTPRCFRQQFNLIAEFQAARSRGSDDAFLSVIGADRECDELQEWQQGFTPKEHQEKRDEFRKLEFQAKREDEEREFRKQMAEAERIWRDQQEEKMRTWQAQQSRSRLRWEIIIFGILVTVAIIGGQVLAAFIQRGSLG